MQCCFYFLLLLLKKSKYIKYIGGYFSKMGWGCICLGWDELVIETQNFFLEKKYLYVKEVYLNDTYDVT